MSKVVDIMVKDVVTIEPQNSVATAIRLMRQAQVRRLPVLEHGVLVGIVTSGDVRRITGLSSVLRDRSQDNFVWQHIPVANIMTSDPITLSPDASAADAARMLTQHKIGGLPVLDHGVLVGIITTSNLLEYLIELETLLAGRAETVPANA